MQKKKKKEKRKLSSDQAVWDYILGKFRFANSAVICRIASTPPPPMNKSISDVTFHWLPASNWLFTFFTKEKEID
ncbi:hypothetical protein T4E_8784 [Trichinella pseudospiralis]|uniref:Uncharacterized protein n=1 Tax=Trichinella pseudospiralis TaxID=6337 RepID=A0A0V0Y893_TRIPS|nr:hypothetical protein T4E_8784 [Trichinella pseudospiralis]